MRELPIMAGAAGAIEGELVSSASTAIAASSAPATGDAMAFSFGDPEPVLDRREISAMMECWQNGRYYSPPISQDGLVRAFEMAAVHGSCIRLKVNLLAKYFIPSRWLDRPTFRKWALDFLTLGNGYLERRDNLAGRPLKLEHVLGRYARRGVEPGTFFFVPGWKQEHEFRPGSVHHLIQAHPSQEIYGLPEYLSALQSGLLNEAATLFRRKYYKNGSHAGYILYATGAGLSNDDADKMREALRQSKGPGNFRNLFLHAPAGKEGDVKVIPISEVAAKDEFLGIKNTTRDDMLTAHRTPGNLVGVVPANPGGFGDLGKAMDGFVSFEIEPLQMIFRELNDWFGLPVVDFAPYESVAGAAAKAA